MKWTNTSILTKEGKVSAVAPEIISASRSTDIPARHAQWFIHRLQEGYVKWTNPFNRKPQYISFEKARIIVFWSKNPEPLIPYLHLLDERGILYYFQYTLNDYDNEGLEPCIPKLKQRIDTFRHLADIVGKDRVIWRFDPLILTNTLSPEILIDKLQYVGEQVSAYTQKLVFSFADITAYRKVESNLKRLNIRYREFDIDDVNYIAEHVANLSRKWGIKASTCAEIADLSRFDISHNKCIDDQLILRLAKNDNPLRSLVHIDSSGQNALFETRDKSLNKILKDTGQRKECGCIFSKDIGQYDTCPNLCVYCYANTSKATVEKNTKNSQVFGESILSDR